MAGNVPSILLRVSLSELRQTEQWLGMFRVFRYRPTVLIEGQAPSCRIDRWVQLGLWNCSLRKDNSTGNRTRDLRHDK
jgi:hypothetical protein